MTVSAELSCPITTKPAGTPPDGWKWDGLCEVARLESGHTPSRRVPSYWEGGDVPWLSLKDIKGLNGKYVMDTVDHPTPHGIDNSSARLLPKGTVALCRTASVGNVAILGKEMATSQDFVNWVCGPRLLPEYLYWAFRSSASTFAVEKQGSTHQTIYMPVVARFNVLLPPLPEQRRIADILDRAESLRAKRRAAIARLDELTQAIFVEMFGDPIENPHRFPVSQLIHLVDDRRPISYGILMPGPDQTNGVKYVRVVDMKGGGIELSGIRKTTEEKSNSFRRSLLKEGDILMSIRGHVGRCATVPSELEGANITQDTARLAIQGANSTFVRECLRTSGMQHWMVRHTKGVAVRGINLGDVKLIPVIVPPISHQRDFARRIGTVDKLKSAHRASLSELDALFGSLQHRAFRGEL